MQMLWDDECLYIAAEMEEPHLWATLTEHDSIIFHDNDFEVFLDPDVVKAIKSGALGRIAVAMLDWSSPNYDRVVLDWTIVEDQASATALAEKVRRIPRTPGNRTSISGALERGTLMLNESDNKIVATRKVIDVSGDGPNNDGISLQHIHDTTADNGIVVNGLPIMDENAEGYVPDLDKYYAACVVAGKGAFLVVVKKYKDKIVLSRPPKKRKTKRRPTLLQKDRREIMKEAVFFARRINDDPIKKAAWKKRAKGYTNVYQAAVAFYMKNGEKKSRSLS